MANQLYHQLEEIVSHYIGAEKAERALTRQLERCGATPDSVTKDHLHDVHNFLLGATKLYLHPDKAKQAELADKITSLEL